MLFLIIALFFVSQYKKLWNEFVVFKTMKSVEQMFFSLFNMLLLNIQSFYFADWNYNKCNVINNT